MTELLAVEGDECSHGDGQLHPANNNLNKFFVQGKLVALVGSDSDDDALTHTSDEVKPGTGTSKLFVGGIAVHRNNDQRNCFGQTVVTNQSKAFSN